MAELYSANNQECINSNRQNAEQEFKGVNVA
jgi:hypothetical protein